MFSQKNNCLVAIILWFQKNHFLYSREEYVGACNAKKPVFPICHFWALVMPKLSAFHQFNPHSCPPFFLYHPRELFLGTCDTECSCLAQLSAFHQFDPHSCLHFAFVFILLFTVLICLLLPKLI